MLWPLITFASELRFWTFKSSSLTYLWLLAMRDNFRADPMARNVWWWKCPNFTVGIWPNTYPKINATKRNKPPNVQQWHILWVQLMPARVGEHILAARKVVHQTCQRTGKPVTHKWHNSTVIIASPQYELEINDRGEPAVSYRWTGWVWDLTGRSSRLQENYRSFWRNLWNIPQFNKGKPEDVNM
jgi:hypothetical protein